MKSWQTPCCQRVVRIKAQANDKGKREKMRTKPAKVILFFRAIHLEQFSNINATNSNSKHRTVKSNRKRHRALAFSNNRWKRIITKFHKLKSYGLMFILVPTYYAYLDNEYQYLTSTRSGLYILMLAPQHDIFTLASNLLCLSRQWITTSSRVFHLSNLHFSHGHCILPRTLLCIKA